MKIVLFTPAIKISAIGRMACLVARELLTQGHEVVVVRTENDAFLDKPTHDFGVELVSWNDSGRVASLANQADALVYQVGDNYQFHRGCLEWLPHLPGIICLHDFFLGHLFHDWSQEHRQEADATLYAWYGDEAARRFFNYPNSEAFIEGTRNASPMTEWICSMAHGVITHSNWEIERVLNSCPGPVYIVPLAYDAPENLSKNSVTHSSDSGRFKILTIGHINPNKRVASVIRAIGNSPLLRQRSTYRLAGNIRPETIHELTALARDLGIDIVISGEVDDAALAHAVEEADVLSCLRWPTLEAASASAIEAMLYGKATIVTNAGFYSEIPDSCVIKIDPENEISDLQIALEQLCEDQERRHTLGSQSQQWAKNTFTAENYANKLVDIVSSVIKTKPTITAVNYFVSVMNAWGATETLICSKDTINSLIIFEGSGPVATSCN
jgi:glycosyltransferase involved in cell wall biosynthesis